MVIKIQNYAKTSDILVSSGTVPTGENLPAVVFSRDGWDIIRKHRRNINSSFQRDVDFQNYSGSSGKVGNVTIYLSGSNRNTAFDDFEEAIKDPVYFDCDEFNSKYTGYYTFEIVSINRIENAKIIIINCSVREYDNG